MKLGVLSSFECFYQSWLRTIEINPESAFAPFPDFAPTPSTIKIVFFQQQKKKIYCLLFDPKTIVLLLLHSLVQLYGIIISTLLVKDTIYQLCYNFNVAPSVGLGNNFATLNLIITTKYDEKKNTNRLWIGKSHWFQVPFVSI